MNATARTVLGQSRSTRRNFGPKYVNTLKRQKVNVNAKPTIAVNLEGKYKARKNPLVNKNRTVNLYRQNSFFSVNKTRRRSRS